MLLIFLLPYFIIALQTTEKKGTRNMSEIMKNINKSEVLVLKNEISYQEGQIVSKTLIQNQSLSITLFAFDKGEEISTHESLAHMSPKVTLLLLVLMESVKLQLMDKNMN